MKAFIAIVGLTSGNFIYQAVTGEQWPAAFERSFFQSAAILCYAFLMRPA